MVALRRRWRRPRKVVLLDDLPRELGNFQVRDDGRRRYFAYARDFYVSDAEGKLLDKYGAPTAARESLPPPDGWSFSVLTCSSMSWKYCSCSLCSFFRSKTSRSGAEPFPFEN